MISRRVKLLGIGMCILTALCVIAGNVYAESAKELYEKAIESRNNFKYDQAIEELSRAIQLDPTVAEYYTMRGELYRNKSDLTQAISDYSKSIELDPNNWEVYYFRAISYMFTKEYDKSWDDVHKAQSLNKDALFPGLIQDLQKASGRDK